jgi:hypothetical protein
LSPISCWIRTKRLGFWQQNGIGYILGDFFYKLIWSPWLRARRKNTITWIRTHVFVVKVPIGVGRRRLSCGVARRYLVILVRHYDVTRHFRALLHHASLLRVITTSRVTLVRHYDVTRHSCASLRRHASLLCVITTSRVTLVRHYDVTRHCSAVAYFIFKATTKAQKSYQWYVDVLRRNWLLLF